MTLEQQLLETVRALPTARQQEVLDFADFIKGREGGLGGPRPFGLCAGEFEPPADFNEPLPEDVLRTFEQ